MNVQKDTRTLTIIPSRAWMHTHIPICTAWINQTWYRSANWIAGLFITTALVAADHIKNYELLNSPTIHYQLNNLTCKLGFNFQTIQYWPITSFWEPTCTQLWPFKVPNYIQRKFRYEYVLNLLLLDCGLVCAQAVANPISIIVPIQVVTCYIPASCSHSRSRDEASVRERSSLVLCVSTATVNKK